MHTSNLSLTYSFAEEETSDERPSNNMDAPLSKDCFPNQVLDSSSSGRDELVITASKGSPTELEGKTDQSELSKHSQVLVFLTLVYNCVQKMPLVTSLGTKTAVQEIMTFPRQELMAQVIMHII